MVCDFNSSWNTHWCRRTVNCAFPKNTITWQTKLLANRSNNSSVCWRHNSKGYSMTTNPSAFDRVRFSPQRNTFDVKIQFLQDRLPTLSIDNVAPKEAMSMWFSITTLESNFGCIALILPHGYDCCYPLQRSYCFRASMCVGNANLIVNRLKQIAAVRC